MYKKSIFLHCLLMLQGHSLLQSSVVISDTFDFGPMIPARHAVSEGMTIHNRGAVEGIGYWNTHGTSIQPLFGGSPDADNGYLNISSEGSNARIHMDFDFSTGKVLATIDFSFASLGSSGSRGIFFGFDSSNRDNALMTNASTDTVWVRIRPDSIVSRRLVGGNENNHVGTFLSLSQQEGMYRGTATLRYNLDENSVTIEVKSGDQLYLHEWDLVGLVPDFGAVAINTVRANDARIHHFRIETIE